MRKLFTIATALLISGSCFSQGLELTAKGSYRSTWLFNDNLSNLGDSQDYDEGWGYNYGISGTFYFTKSIGIGLDGLLGKFSGNYAGVIDSIGSYTSGVTLETLDIPLLLKLRTQSGGSFIELGPQYTIIQKAYYQMSGDSMSVETTDVTDEYSDNNLSVLLGLGVNLDLTDHLFVTTGIRFEYGVGDLEGIDAVGESFKNFFRYEEYKKTYSAAGGIFLGLTYRFGSTESSSNNAGVTP